MIELTITIGIHAVTLEALKLEAIEEEKDLNTIFVERLLYKDFSPEVKKGVQKIANDQIIRMIGGN